MADPSPSRPITLTVVPYHDSIAVVLRDRLTAELGERYRRTRRGEGHSRPSRQPQAEQFDHPYGAFLMAFTGTEAVGCGGLRRWGPEIGEIKRMYVLPSARGLGVGRAILEGLEETARSLSYRSIRLETGTPQPEAIGLYEAAGYVRMEPYRRDWAHHFSVAMHKALGHKHMAAGILLHDDARLDDPEVVELCDRLEQEETRRYGPQDVGAGAHVHPSPPTPREFAPPEGLFVVARLDGRSVGCGGVRRFERTIAEVKRMYVDPPARRQGIARRILGSLEDSARRSGYRSVRLQTGNRQPEAMALYSSAGYERIAPYGDHRGDPFSVCFAKRLDPMEVHPLGR